MTPALAPRPDSGDGGPGPLLQLEPRDARWVKVLDQTRCIGCHACTTACKSENEVPLGVTRTYVKAVDVGVFPQARRAFQVTRCNQCSDAPCVAACPTAAMFRRPDGIVDFDKSACIGCKACIAACPYDAIFINPEDHSAEKCNFCAHRLDVGLEPACVTVCPTQAILVGDLNDPASRVAAIVGREPVAVRRPEKETRPGLFYRGATQATLDPLAARRPGGGTFMWSELVTGEGMVNSGHPGTRNSSAAAVLAYDVPHRMPWDWRVSLYTWTKGIAAGAYLVPLLLLVAGVIGAGSPLWTWFAPIVAGAFLGLTGLLLIWDLEHPRRFVKIFLRPQWRSWLVRGAVIITGYAVVLFLHFVSTIAVGLGAGSAPGMNGAAEALAIAGAPLALATAAYTAWLFAQATARDLWQSPMLAPHLAVQAVLLGSTVSLLAALAIAPEAVAALALAVGASAAAHVAMVAAEVLVPHPTAHAHLARHELVRGSFGPLFWFGLALAIVGVATPLLVSLDGAAAGGAAIVAALGLLAHEHAFVQAGQSVPLA